VTSAPKKYSHWVVQATGKADRRFTDISQVRARLPEIFAGDEIVLGELPVPEKHPIPLYVNDLPRLKPALPDPNSPIQQAVKELWELQAEAQQLERLLLQLREYAASLSTRITKVLHALEDEL
jgi:hypothetical protein